MIDEIPKDLYKGKLPTESLGFLRETAQKVRVAVEGLERTIAEGEQFLVDTKAQHAEQSTIYNKTYGKDGDKTFEEMATKVLSSAKESDRQYVEDIRKERKDQRTSFQVSLDGLESTIKKMEIGLSEYRAKLAVMREELTLMEAQLRGSAH